MLFLIRRLALAAVALAMLIPTVALSAASQPYVSDRVTARLITAEDGVAPGAGKLSAGLHLQLADNWKTYWRSPGEVGLAPELTFDEARNIANVDILWPAPTRFTAFEIENIGYLDEVVFPLDVSLKDPGQSTRLVVSATILLCAEICVPESFTLDLDIPIGTGIDGASGTLIARYADTVPVDGARIGLTVDGAHLDADANTLTVALRSTLPMTNLDLFPELGQASAFGSPDIRTSADGRSHWSQFAITASDPGAPLTLTATGDGMAATLTAVDLDGFPPPAPDGVQTGPGPGTLLGILGLALLGGLILNVMPCVLPVLSIKVASALAARDTAPGQVRVGFLAASAGVIAFFWALAALLIGLKAIGVSVGWGIQFQNPVFLILITAILILFAANMLGLFEITLPQSLNTGMNHAGGRGGLMGEFATGAFAALMATPCSAPFLGTAVAFALVGPPTLILVVFTALGVGLAVPYLVLAAYPRALSVLPRPGPWMVRVKWVLGAALALTAAWIVTILIAVTGPLGTTAAVALILSATALVSFGRMRRETRPLAALCLVLALGLPAILPDPVPARYAADPTRWQPFRIAEVAPAVAAGSVVFVDVTADWCLTCKANKRLVLDRADVQTALSGPGIVTMQADWTRQDATITRYLQANGRFGIPFNIVYGPARPDGITLPELLTPSAVLDAMKEAGASTLAADAEG